MSIQVKKIPETVATFAPLPVTKRGFGIHLHGTVQGSRRIVYGNGPNVVIRYLDDDTRADVFDGHKTNVTVAKFSPNGQWIASGDDQGTVLVWAAGGDHIVKNNVRCCMGILDIAWNGKGDMIMAGGNGGSGHFGKVFRWDSTNAIGQITNNAKKILSVTMRPERPFKVAVCNEEKQMCFYPGTPFKFAKSDRTHENYPNCIRYNHSGSMFATCGSDRKIVLYDGLEGDKVKEFPEKHTGSIYSLSWSPNDDKIITCAGDKTAIVWNVDGSVDSTYTLGSQIDDMQVSCLWLGEDLVTVSLSGDINFLNPQDVKTPKKVLSGHQAAVDCIAVSPDGGQIYSGDRNGRLCVTESKTGETEALSGVGHQGVGEERGSLVSHLAVSADGSKLFSVGHDNKLFVSSNKNTPAQWLALEGQPRCLAAANKNAALCVVGTARGVLHVVENGQEKKRVLLGFEPTCVSFSPDDSEVCIGRAFDEKQGVSTIQRGKAITYTFSGYDLNQKAELIVADKLSPVTCCAYSDDGVHISVGDTMRHVFIFKRDSNAVVNERGWQYHQAKITAVAWTKDSKKMLSSSTDESVITWPRASDGKPFKRVKTDPAHLQGVLDLKVLDDKRFVTVGADRYIRVWDIPA